MSSTTATKGLSTANCTEESSSEPVTPAEANPSSPPPLVLIRWPAGICLDEQWEETHALFQSVNAEIQWLGIRPVLKADKVDVYEVCTQPRQCLVKASSRRVVYIADYDSVCDAKVYLLAYDNVLWVPSVPTHRDTIAVFLQGTMAPAEVKEHNRKLLFTEQLNTKFLVFCPNPNKPNVNHAELRLTKPKWTMPPVPAEGEELPLILVDVDGCVGYSPGPQHPPFNQYVVDQLNEWSRSQKGEVRWLTYRGERVYEYVNTIGVDHFPHGRDVYVEDPDKEVQVLRWLQRNPKRKIVWLDDEIRSYFKLFEQRDRHRKVFTDWLVEQPNLLMVQPRSSVGLQRKDLQLANAFLDGSLTAEEVLEQNNKILGESQRWWYQYGFDEFD